MVKNKNQVNSITFKVKIIGQRVDNFLLKYLKKVPRNKIYHIIRKGEVRINSKRVKPEYKLKFHDLIRVPPLYCVNVKKNVNFIKLKGIISKIKKCVIYEDQYLIALNKPNNIAVHGGSGFSLGVIEILRIIYFRVKYLELVHRLDFDTSGILLIAKKYNVLRSLHEQWRLKKVKKEYIALVKGNWSPDIKVIRVPLLKYFSKNGHRIVKVDYKGKSSETRFKIKEVFFQFTLLKIYPITGRSHQIRVHTQYASHPIVCDNKYGDFKFNKKLRSFGLNRFFLHASSIQFIHPVFLSKLILKAPIDNNLKNYLEFIRNKEDGFF